MSDISQPDLLGDIASDGLSARSVALHLLTQVLGQKKMLDSALERDAAFARLPARDRGFARMLVATTLRRKGQLDDLLLRAMDKGEMPRPESLHRILLLGIAQIMFMDVPDHAAVDTSVRLCAQEGLESKKGFVNAILRRMTGEGKEWLAAQDPASLNIPAWLYTQWSNSYGIAKARDIALASLDEAALDITVKNPREQALWAGALEAEILPTGTLRRRAAGGTVTELPGFQEGAWWVQDASSALPAKLLGDVAGKDVLDLCAAPGGKTAQLAAAGAAVTALDRSAARMGTLMQNLERLGLRERVRTLIEDGSLWRPRQEFSHILLDAPCSATGTIRRHPDLLSLKSERDQQGLLSIQERLLHNTAGMLAVGGILIYCTCSLQRSEGEGQIEKFLLAHRNYRRVAIRASEIGNIIGALTGDGDVRLLPQHLADMGGMDGFYIARLQRQG